MEATEPRHRLVAELQDIAQAGAMNHMAAVSTWIAEQFLLGVISRAWGAIGREIYARLRT